MSFSATAGDDDDCHGPPFENDEYAAEMNGEMGDLPSVDIPPNESYQQMDVARKQQYTSPLEDYEDGLYHESANDIHQLWLVILAEMMRVATLNGGEATFITPWLPWEASKKTDFKLHRERSRASLHHY